LLIKSKIRIDKPLEEIQRIDSIQNKKYPNAAGRYMNPQSYYSQVEIRKEKFKVKWEEKGFLSWNYPEYKAYRMLFEKI